MTDTVALPSHVARLHWHPAFCPPERFAKGVKRLARQLATQPDDLDFDIEDDRACRILLRGLELRIQSNGDADLAGTFTLSAADDGLVIRALPEVFFQQAPVRFSAHREHRVAAETLLALAYAIWLRMVSGFAAALADGYACKNNPDDGEIRNSMTSRPRADSKVEDRAKQFALDQMRRPPPPTTAFLLSYMEMMFEGEISKGGIRRAYEAALEEFRKECPGTSIGKRGPRPRVKSAPA